MTSEANHNPLSRFAAVAEIVWQYLGLPPLTPVQREACDWLQYGPDRSQMWAFRGMGKSYLCSAYACFLGIENPDEKILVISASKDRADAFVQFTKRLINDIPIFHHLKPNPRRGDRDSNVAFDFGCCTPAHSPSVKAVGVTGQMSGSRGSCIILDDVEVPANSGTPSQREKLKTTLDEIEAVILPKSELMGIVPRIRVLGTPQSMDTVYLRLEEAGYQPRIWPVHIPSKEIILGYRGCLAPSIQKMVDDGEPEFTPTEPSRFPRSDFEVRKRMYGSLGFALQFLLSTALSDAEKYPLKIRDAMFAPFMVDKVRQVYVHSNHHQFKLPDVESPGMQGDGFYRPADTIGDWVTPDDTIVAVDPSGRGADETSIVSMSVNAGFIFVHRVFGSPDGYEDATLRSIAEEAKRVKATKIVVEANYGDGMFSRLLQPVLQKIYPCSIEEVKHSAVKERRIIDTLSPVLESHRIIFHETIPTSDRVPHRGDSDTKTRDRQLFYQLTHLTDERGCLPHDDRLDCLAMGVAFFNRHMGVNAHDELREQQRLAQEAFNDRGIVMPDGDMWTSTEDLGSDSLLQLDL